jgi:3-oxoacyl-[acyl-carrier protein] reductase
MTDQRVALVTGASRGIGQAIALRLAQGGFHVVVNHRASAEQAEATAHAICAADGSADVVQADVTELAAVRRMVRDIRARHGRLDVLVNNAGRRADGFLLLTRVDQWWSVFNDNVASVVNVTRAALPALLASRPAAIVNVSSVSGVRGTDGQTAYSAAKAAVIGFTKALARELAGKGVSVNCVAPGPIETEMLHAEPVAATRLKGIPLGRIGQPAEVAEVVALLAEGHAQFVHGQVVVIDGGLSG